MTKGVVVGLVILSVLLLVTAPAQAQTPTPSEINAVARELWCPLCNGVRLDNCELRACEQMKEVIAQKLAAGENRDQIKAYFVEQYGDVVLGAPASQGFNLVVWLFPILAAVVGLGWLAYLVRAWRRRKPKQATAGPKAGPAAAQDEYLQRVEDELRQMD